MKRFSVHLRSRRALLAAAAVATAFGAGPPATANAASVGYTAGTIAYTTAPGEANHLAVEPWGLAFKLTETGTKGRKATAIALIAGSGCFQVSSTTAACPGTATRITADLGDSDDFFDATLVPISVNVIGGAGNDVLHGGLGADTLDGGGGNDSFEARDAAADILVCGLGIESGNADSLDTIPGDCETVVRAAAPAPPQLSPAPDTTIPDPVVVDPSDPQPDPLDPTPGIDSGVSPDPQGTTPRAANAVPATIPAQTVGVSASGVASVRIVCPADSGGCSGAVTIVLPAGAAPKHTGRGKLASAATSRRRAPLKIGRAKFTAAAGTAPIVPVQLSKRGRQRIVKGRHGRAKIVVRTRKADGTVSVATQDVAIRLKRRPSKAGAGRR